MAQEQRTVAELDTKRLADIAEFERVIIDWCKYYAHVMVLELILSLIKFP